MGAAFYTADVPSGAGASAECRDRTRGCAAHIPVFPGGFCLLQCHSPRRTTCLLCKVCCLSGAMMMEEPP